MIEKQLVEEGRKITFRRWDSLEILTHFSDREITPPVNLPRDAPFSYIDLPFGSLTGDDARLLKYLAQRGAFFLTAEFGGSGVGTEQTLPTWQARGILGPEPSSNEWYLGAMDLRAPDSAGLSCEKSSEPDLAPLLWEVLLEEAQLIALSGGATRLLSPLTLSSWFPYRLRLDHDPEEYPWEPRKVRGLEQAFLATGFLGLERYRSVGSLGLSDFAQRIFPAYDAALARGFTFKSMAQMPDRIEAIKKLWAICQDAFQKNPYFAPISFEDFVAFYIPKISSHAGSDQATAEIAIDTLCLSPLGEIAGFILAYQSKNELVFKSMAIDRPFQGSRLGDAILYPMASSAASQGIDHFVSALVLEGNRSEFVFRKNTTRWEHHYGIFGRQLQVY